MALRLYSEFNGDQGDLYKIEIHDSEWLGGSYSFQVASDGFTLDYSGQTDDLITPIVSSQLSFSIAYLTGQVGNCIEDMKLYQEKRFRVRIYKNDTYQTAIDYKNRVEADGGTFEALACVEDAIGELGGNDYALFWVGIIMQDLVEIEDVSEPYFVTISATDLGPLGNIELKPAVASDQTLLNVFEYCIDQLGLDDLYGAADNYLSTCLNWWDTNMVYSTSSDVARLLRFNTATFYDKQEDGTYIYPSCMDVLTELATLFNARVYQKDGCFHFEQYSERVNASRISFFYDKTATLLTSETIADDVTLNGTIDWGARLAGNSFNYLPALKKVVATYQNEVINNLMVSNRIWTSANTLEAVGIVANDNNAQVMVTGSGKYAVTYNGSGATVSNYFYIPVFRMTLRLEDVNTPGSYWYLKRDYNGYGTATPYGVTSWTTTASYYYFDLGQNQIQPQGQIYIKNISVLTPPLPIDGTLSFDIDLYQTYNLSGGSSSLPANYSATWSFSQLNIEYLVNGNNANALIYYSSTNGNTKVNSNLTLDLGDIRLGDSHYLMLGSLQVFNGSAWVNSSFWRKGNSGSYIRLLSLLTKEVLGLHYRPIERYQGTIVGVHSYGSRYIFDSIYWMPLSMSYDANKGEWGGEWFAIAQDVTDVTALDAVAELTIDRSPTTSSNDGGVNVGFFDSGRIAGMEINAADSQLGPFQEFTGGGRVVGEFNTTGNATLDQKLLVDGGTVLGLGSAVTAFSTRVTTDGGTTESLSCVTTAITALSGDTVSVLQDTSISENLEVQKATDLKSTLAVTGASTLSSTLAVTGATTMSSTLGVTGATTLSSTLGVTGKSTFAADADFEGSHSALIQDVEHSNGSEYDVRDTDFIVFNSWTGANGQAYINLPSVSDSEGRMIRFKSDNTIGASNYVTLRPDAGDTGTTIDGETSADFDRPYDGIMVICHNSDWYIVQRKSK